MLRINSKKVSEQKAGCQGVQRGNEHSDAQKFGRKESEEIRRNRLEQESVQPLFYSSQFLIPKPWSVHRIYIVDTTGSKSTQIVQVDPQLISQHKPCVLNQSLSFALDFKV